MGDDGEMDGVTKVFVAIVIIYIIVSIIRSGMSIYAAKKVSDKVTSGEWAKDIVVVESDKIVSTGSSKATVK